ncbi:hypothetical protein V8F20_012268 [Naviculisporaceae sp. PSN 640]
MRFRSRYGSVKRRGFGCGITWIELHFIGNAHDGHIFEQVTPYSCAGMHGSVIIACYIRGSCKYYSATAIWCAGACSKLHAAYRLGIFSQPYGVETSRRETEPQRLGAKISAVSVCGTGERKRSPLPTSQSSQGQQAMTLMMRGRPSAHDSWELEGQCHYTYCWQNSDRRRTLIPGNGDTSCRHLGAHGAVILNMDRPEDKTTSVKLQTIPKQSRAPGEALQEAAACQPEPVVENWNGAPQLQNGRDGLKTDRNLGYAERSAKYGFLLRLAGYSAGV